MKQKCLFCKDVDLQPVVEGLATNLQLAIETGVVSDTGISPEYNHIDDPAMIHGRIRDVFDAINAQQHILAKGRINNQSNNSQQSTGDPGQTA